MKKPLIIAAEKIIDGQGGLSRCQALEARIRSSGIEPRCLTIDPLRTDWHSALQADHFRSGCGPLDALASAQALIVEQGVEAVVISGEDALKSGYSRTERLRLMSIYGDEYPLTAAYDALAGHFIRRQGVSESLFRLCAEKLFENYSRSFLALGHSIEDLPDKRWFDPITARFRGVDCANPMVDFCGRLLLVSEDLASKLAIPSDQCVAVSGIDVQHLDGDGEAYLDEISSYQHLQQAYRNCCAQAGIDFAARFRDHQALLEVYSCYPVVPMAFMLCSGLIADLEQLPGFLNDYPVTVTGGMNLARGPWNNPALNGLISCYQQLQCSPLRLAAVHGNGGLGYRQGVAILQQQ